MTLSFSRALAALGCGAIFGFGLALSGMMDPARVRGFLDVLGRFDPSLGFVLAGALAVSAAGYALSRRMRRPLLESAFHVPGQGKIDARLIAGAAIFGLGWGMGGLCPGPAISSLSLALPQAFVFVCAMIAGILIHDHWQAVRRLVESLSSARRAADADADA